MKKKYLKPEVINVVVLPHFNLLLGSEKLNIYDKGNDNVVNENDYDDLL